MTDKKRRSDWGLMQKLIIGPNDDPYMTRWYLMKTPLGGLYLHKMSRPDRRPVFHDHPWGFISLILWGGYVEHRLNSKTRRATHQSVRWVNRMHAFDAHYITHLHKKTSWSLVIVGRRTRTWGYWQVASADAEVPESDRSWIWEPWYLVEDDAA